VITHATSGAAATTPLSPIRSPAADEIAAADADLRLHLRWLADTYERVQAIRIECGERIRAIAQGRTAGTSAVDEPADALLSRIRTGDDDGPIAVLGRTYRTHWIEERTLRAAMSAALDCHPAWPWLRQVSGMGPTLATKLLARLDLRRAATPSSFWSYCGLATVPAPGDAAVRIAPPRVRRGERPGFDRAARRVCFQIGIALLRARGSYAAYYHRERVSIENSPRGWNRGHVHMAALRKTEKLLLAHLWCEWTAALGAPQRQPYVFARRRAQRCITSREMIAT
jgi:hypothetical protein